MREIHLHRAGRNVSRTSDVNDGVGRRVRIVIQSFENRERRILEQTHARVERFSGSHAKVAVEFLRSGRFRIVHDELGV